MANQSTRICRRIEQRGDLGLGQLLPAHRSVSPCGLTPADQPIRARESISVLRLIPKVRQTAALVAPPSSAATTAAIFSASIATGRPPRRPRRRAAARPALTRSWVNDRSNCAKRPEDMEQEFALRGGGVHLLGQRAERHTAFLEAVHCRQQVGQRSPETVEFPNHEAIARLEEGQSLGKAGTIVAAAAGAIFEQMPLVDPRRQQASRCRSITWRSPSVETRIYPTSMYGNPQLIGFRTLCHSDSVCRTHFEARIGRRPAYQSPVGKHLFAVGGPLVPAKQNFGGFPDCRSARSRSVRLCVSEAHFVSSGRRGSVSSLLRSGRLSRLSVSQ